MAVGHRAPTDFGIYWTIVNSGQPLRVVVRGYDDNGRGVPVAGATVTAGDLTAVTGADGTAGFQPLGAPAVEHVQAERAGMVTSFPVVVRAG